MGKTRRHGWQLKISYYLKIKKQVNLHLPVFFGWLVLNPNNFLLEIIQIYKITTSKLLTFVKPNLISFLSYLIVLELCLNRMQYDIVV